MVRALIRCSSSTIRSRRSLCWESLEAYSRRMALVTISIEIDQFGLTYSLIAGMYNWYQFAPKCVCFIFYASREQNRIKKWWGLYYQFSFSFYLFWFLKCDSSCGIVSCMWWRFFFLHFYYVHCPSNLDFMNGSGNLNFYLSCTAAYCLF